MVKDIGTGMKSSIIKVVAARSFAVDPRNVYMLTYTLIVWTWAGLTKRYGGETIPEDTTKVLGTCRSWWQAAGQLIKTEETWEQSTMRCHEVAVECLKILVTNDLIDYDIFDESITEALFGGGRNYDNETVA